MLQGLSFIILGLGFLYAVLLFPFDSILIFGTGLTSIVLEMLLLSFLLLVGSAIVFWGITLLFHKKLVVFSRLEGSCFQASYINRYEYNSKIAELDERFNVATTGQENSNQPIALFYADEIVRKPENDPQQLASKLASHALFRLIVEGFFELHSYQEQETRVKDLAQSTLRKTYVVCSNEKDGNDLLGTIEKKFIKVLCNWHDYEGFYDSPFGPSIKQLLIQTYGGKPSEISSAILEDASKDLDAFRQVKAVEFGLEQEHFKTYIESLVGSNSELKNILRAQSDLFFEAEHSAFLPYYITIADHLTAKNFRIAIFVSAVLIFTLGRYISSFNQVQTVGRFMQQQHANVSDLGSNLKDLLPDLKKEDLLKHSRLFQKQISVWLSQPNKYFAQLVEQARNSDVEIRRFLTAKLSNLQVEAEKLLPFFIDALRDPDLVVREQAIKGLISLGADAAPAVPDLLEIAATDVRLKDMASDALRDIGLKNSDAVVAQIASKINRASPELKREAGRVLKDIGSEDALRLLKEYGLY